METTLFESLDLPIHGNVSDQYADGKAAKAWPTYCIDVEQRKRNCKDFLVGLLRENNCRRILDAACGTGVDSVMLIEEGFEVVSVDASVHMLKHAWKTRWERRKEQAFENWEIEEANWLTLDNDIEHLIGDGFDAVLCLGSSFPHVLDLRGDQQEQKQALLNLEKCVKPGGLLLIDHRNYDYIIEKGQAPPVISMYYTTDYIYKIESTIVYKNEKPNIMILDYYITDDTDADGKPVKTESEFRLSYYPHTLQSFKSLLDGTLRSTKKHEVFGDFKPLDSVEDPGFYIHLLRKK